MNLLFVHKLLIGMAILFCLGFGVATLYRGGLALGIGFTAAGFVLIGYLRWMIRTKAPRLDRRE